MVPKIVYDICSENNSGKRSDKLPPPLGLLKISISSQIISALPSWMFLGVCDEILIDLKPFGVLPTARIAHENFQDP